MSNQLYNAFSWFLHQVLHWPIRLHVAFDNRVRRAQVTVVFLHGISATSTTWNSTLKQFSKDHDLATVRLVALDLLGFGKSLHADWLKYNQAEYLRALHKTIRKLRPHGKLILVGHSMGAIIAANYVVNYERAVDIRSLILVSPPVLMADDLAKLPDQVYTKSYAALHKIAKDVPAAEVLAKIAEKFTSFRSSYIKTAAFERSMENIILDPHNYRTFIKIHLPTLLIHGHFDPLVLGANLRRIAARNPRYISYISVIGQHDISIGKRAKILAEIKKILKEA